MFLLDFETVGLWYETEVHAGNLILVQHQELAELILICWAFQSVQSGWYIKVELEKHHDNKNSYFSVAPSISRSILRFSI